MADEQDGLGSVGEVADPQPTATGATPQGASSDKGSGAGAAEAGGAQVDVKSILEWQSKADKRLNDLYDKANRDRDVLGGKIEKLVETLQSTAQSTASVKSRAEMDRAREDLKKRYDAGELGGDELFGLLDGLAGDLTTQQEAKAKALADELAALKTTLNTRLADLDPEYQAHKDKVAVYIEKYGMSREAAIKLAKDTAAPSNPAAPALAGSVQQGMPSGEGTGTMTDGQFAQVCGLAGVDPTKITPKQRTDLIKKWSK